MTPPQARRQLLALRARLLGRTHEDGPAVRGDEGDQAAATLALEVGAVDVDRVRARVRAIERAILRVDAGTYHLCERCGERIGARRHEAVPEASECRSCAEVTERRAREDQG